MVAARLEDGWPAVKGVGHGRRSQVENEEGRIHGTGGAAQASGLERFVVPRKTSKRATYHHGDLARALLEEAVRLIREVGPDAVSIRELARRIGVNHAAVYRHYEDKDTLLAAVAEDGWRSLAQEIERSLDAPSLRDASSVDRLVAIGAAYTRFALAHPAHYGVMTGPRLNEAGRFPSLEVPIQRAFDLIVAELELGRARGHFEGGTTLDWGLRVWMFAHGYVTLVLGRRVAVKPARVEEYFERLFRPMIR